MSEQDNTTVVNTGLPLNDGGKDLDQHDLNPYIRVLMDQRNDANDQVSVYRTKCVRYVAMITEAQKVLENLSKENEELKKENEELKEQLDSLKSASELKVATVSPTPSNNDYKESDIINN